MAFGNLDSGRGCSGYGKLHCRMLVICHLERNKGQRDATFDRTCIPTLWFIFVSYCPRLLISYLPLLFESRIGMYMSTWTSDGKPELIVTGVLFHKTCVCWGGLRWLNRGRDRAWDITRQPCNKVMTSSFIDNIWLPASIGKSIHEISSIFLLLMVLITLLQSRGIHLHLPACVLPEPRVIIGSWNQKGILILWFKIVEHDGYDD